MYTHTHTHTHTMPKSNSSNLHWNHPKISPQQLPITEATTEYTVTRNAYSIVSSVLKYMPLQYSPPLFYKKPNTYISNATTGSAFYVAHVVGHYTDRFAILQAARRSPLLKFTAQRGPSM